MDISEISELEDLLQDILPPGFHFGTDKHGQILIYTQLAYGDDDELIPFDSDEDNDFDSDTDSLNVLDDDEDD